MSSPTGTIANIENLNAVAVGLHVIQAVAVVFITAFMETGGGLVETYDNVTNTHSSSALFDGGRFSLVRNVQRWNVVVVAANHTTPAKTMITTVPHAIPSGMLNVHYMIIAFFALSAFFQGAAAVLWQGRSGRLRFAEYSITASIMMLAIALEAGLNDAYLLQATFVLVWVTQMLGLIADSVQTPQKPWAWVVPHLCAWATCLSAYVPSIDAFVQTVLISDARPPTFVTAIIAVSFVLFLSFGIVQLAALYAKAQVYTAADAYPATAAVTSAATHLAIEDIEDDAEYAYILLSIISKTQLAWIILTPTILSSSSSSS
jgi:Heliorhodopsin